METPVHAPFSVKVRLEIAKLRTMKFREKMEYLWEYYKLFFIVIALTLFFIGSIINTVFINPPARTALLIEWSADFVIHEQLDELADVLTEHLVDESVNEVVLASLFFEAAEDPQMQMAMVSRRMALIAAGELDVFIQSEAQLEETAMMGVVMPLDTILSIIEARYPSVFGTIGENLVYAQHDVNESDGSGGQERVVGIDIGGSPLLRELGFHERELIFSVVANSNRLGNALSTLVLLFEGL